MTLSGCKPRFWVSVCEVAMPSIRDGTQWWGHCLWTLTNFLPLSFSLSFPLPENRSSQRLHWDSPSASHPSLSQTGRDSESHTLNAFPQARNSRVVLPLAHVSFQLFLVPSLFSLPFSPVGLSSYVPWASLFLWPPWLLHSGGTTEKTSERMWLCVWRGGTMRRTLCVLLHATRVCVCVCVRVCRIWQLFVKQMTRSMPFQFPLWIWPIIAITAHQKQWSGENPLARKSEDVDAIFFCLAWKHVSLPFCFQSLWNWYLKGFFEKIVQSGTLKPWDTRSIKNCRLNNR